MLSFECGNRLCGKTRHPKKWASTRGSLAGFEHFPAFVKKRCLFGTTVYSWKFHPHLGLWKRQGQQDPNVVFFLNGVKFIVKWLCVGGLVSCLGQGTTSTDLPESIAHVVNGTDCFVPHLNLRNVKFFFLIFSHNHSWVISMIPFVSFVYWQFVLSSLHRSGAGGLWLVPQVEGTGYWQKYFEAMKPPWRGARVASPWVVWGWKSWMIECLLYNKRGACRIWIEEWVEGVYTLVMKHLDVLLQIGNSTRWVGEAMGPHPPRSIQVIQ